MRIDFKPLFGSADCSYSLYTCKDSFPEFSLTLESGKIYGFISDFCAGSWGAVNCIAGKGWLSTETKIYLDNNPIIDYPYNFPYSCTFKKCNELNMKCNKKLRDISCIITEIVFPYKPFLKKHLTARNCIQYAIDRKLTKYSFNEIKEIFYFSEGTPVPRYDRYLKYTSGEIFQITLAINYVLGKKIFCFPWLGTREIGRIDGLLPIINFLKKEDKIILIPSSQYEKLKDICDNFVIFDSDNAKVIIS